MTGGPEYQLKIEEGRVYGARYYTVQPMGWGWHEGAVGWSKMMTWTVNTYGPTNKEGVWYPGERWYANNAKFWFRNQEDLTMFVLKWS